LSPVRRRPSLGEGSRVRSLVAEKANGTLSSRRLVKGTRKPSRPGPGKKSKKSADVMRQEKTSRQSLVHTNGLPARSISASNASVYRYAIKNVNEIS
jgi:hypothetical protein